MMIVGVFSLFIELQWRNAFIVLFRGIALLIDDFGFFTVGMEILGILIAVLGIGMFRGYSWSWYLAIALWILDVVLCLSYGPLFVNITLIFLELTILAYLWKGDVRLFFKADTSRTGNMSTQI